MAKRIIVALIAAAALIAVISLHGYVILGAVFIVSLIVQLEMNKTIRAGGGGKPIAPILYASMALLLPAYYFYGIEGVFFLQVAAISVLFIVGIVFRCYTYESIFHSVFSLYYPQVFFVFLYMIVLLSDVALSRLILLVTFAASIATDSCAYFVGYFLGKRKLCPEISPKKTVEGAIGGLIGGVLGVLIMALLFDNGRIHLIEYAILGVVLSALAQFGDLAASVVKRRFGVKDFGSIMPGHGGLLDRLDSTLFILPVAYLFFKLCLGF